MMVPTPFLKVCETIAASNASEDNWRQGLVVVYRSCVDPTACSTVYSMHCVGTKTERTVTTVLRGRSVFAAISSTMLCGVKARLDGAIRTQLRASSGISASQSLSDRNASSIRPPAASTHLVVSSTAGMPTLSKRRVRISIRSPFVTKMTTLLSSFISAPETRTILPLMPVASSGSTLTFISAEDSASTVASEIAPVTV